MNKIVFLKKVGRATNRWKRDSEGRQELYNFREKIFGNRENSRKYNLRYVY